MAGFMQTRLLFLSLRRLSIFSPHLFQNDGARISYPPSAISRNFSKHAHDEDDDSPENAEILHQLRKRHHYHRLPGHDIKKGHDVFILEPNFKWGRNRFQKITSEHRLGEACGLVNSIENWSVVGTHVESVRHLDGKWFFGKGKIEELTKEFQELKSSSSPIDAVFIDFPRLNVRQHKELEDLWDLKVYDRFGIVLQIFKERAKTSEAKIQVELAELPYIRSRLIGESSYDQQSGGTQSIGGAGETLLETKKRVLFEREQKLKKRLQAIKKRRDHIRHERHKKHMPTVAVVGYTNAGKTSLIKALTGDVKMHPEDRLFATLDVSGHHGKLPSGMHALFIDTVGFVTDLPPELVESFAVTLQDIVHADLIVHVRDISHPDHEAHQEDVMTVLEKQLALRPALMESMLEAQNKIDLCVDEDVNVTSQVVSDKCVKVSAEEKTGLDKLRHLIEEGVMKATGKTIRRIIIPPYGDQLSWLYHEATVQGTSANEEGNIIASVVMDDATHRKYLAKFGSEK